MGRDLHLGARVPFFARVEADGARPLGTMYACNISGGGVYLKAPGLTEGSVPVGRPVELALALPDGGPVVELAGEVVWIDPAVRDHHGARALGLGVRFDPGPSTGMDRIRKFLEVFRYRVAALGVEDPQLCERALSDLYAVTALDSTQALVELAQGGHVGLVLIGEARGPAMAVEWIADITASKELARQPPLVYLGREPAPAIEPLLFRNGRISFARWPIEPVEFRGLVRQALEAFIGDAENDVLTAELRRALDQLRRENQYLRGRVREPTRLQGLVGESESMRRLFALIERVAPSPTTVLIRGETGTGKELVARAIHALSPRKDKPFVAQNCAALAEGLLDAELFGHVRGAFTSAVQERPGLFEAAGGGTVFLDEVGEMAPSMQAKLLRVLESGEVRRVGDSRARNVDVRILSATHRDLHALIRAGRFREDLFYRLGAFEVVIPPLRERRDDISVLTLHFLDRLTEQHGRPPKGLTHEAMRLLEAHAWPGNARELLHTLERLLLLAPEDAKVPAELVRETLNLKDEAVANRALPQVLDAYERSLIESALARSGGVIARAARLLGVDRSTLSKRCKRLEIR
jgi:DNA-binding NtrC family response regulator/Tfp pilus assembly protein PilZ